MTYVRDGAKLAAPMHRGFRALGVSPFFSCGGPTFVKEVSYSQGSF